MVGGLARAISSNLDVLALKQEFAELFCACVKLLIILTIIIITVLYTLKLI